MLKISYYCIKIRLMNEDIHLKYLTIGPHDLLWGMAVNSLGFQEVAP